QHDLVAPALERLADDLLGFAVRVHVGRVDEIDPAVDRGIDDPRRLVVVAVAHWPNIIVPRQCVLTWMPVAPSVRYSLSLLSWAGRGPGLLPVRTPSCRNRGEG